MPSPGVFLLIINLLATVDTFRNRRRFFGEGPDERHYL
jgi:hypothetical protein